MSPKGSAPTLPMKLAAAPKRAAAIAWFEALPPGPSVAPRPASVSCQCGSRGTRLVRSTANRPRTVMRGRGIGRLPRRPYPKPSPAGIDHDIDATALLAAVGVVSAVRRLVGGDRPGLAVAFDRRVGAHEAMAAEPLAHCVRALERERVVVGVAADRVGVAFDRKGMRAGLGDLGTDGNQRIRRIAAQVRLVEGEERVADHAQHARA